MLGNLGVHVLRCPTGKFTLVGTIPARLMLWRKATRADILGQNWIEAPDGTTIAPITPIFDTQAEAETYVETTP